MVADELDTEGHKFAANDNETVVEGASEDASEHDEPIETAGLHRLRR